MANGNIGISGYNYDAFVSSQRTFHEYDFAAKLQEKYYRARQKFLSKIERKEDSCIVLSDSKLDAKLDIYRSIDSSCARLTNILESYQNALFMFANEENTLSIYLLECSKHDKTKAGKMMSIAGKSLTSSSHQRIKLYMPLMRIYQEMETFHSRAVEDTSETVQKLENKRSQYRASLLWMKDISERLDPDIYRQLDKFRRVQNQVRNDKKVFDSLQMDVVQKIDLLMASRCNLLNQILASYQITLLQTFEKNFNNFRSIEEIMNKEDIYEYEFKTLKQLNPLKLSDDENSIGEQEVPNLIEMPSDDNNNEKQISGDDQLIDVTLDDSSSSKSVVKQNNKNLLDSDDQVIDDLETLFGRITSEANEGSSNIEEKKTKTGQAASEIDSKKKFVRPNIGVDLLSMGSDEQISNLLGLDDNKSQYSGSIDQSGHMPPSSSDFDPLGSASNQPNKTPVNAPLDLITNELDEIDNNSNFKSLQGLQL